MIHSTSSSHPGHKKFWQHEIVSGRSFINAKHIAAASFSQFPQYTPGQEFILRPCTGISDVGCTAAGNTLLSILFVIGGLVRQEEAIGDRTLIAFYCDRGKILLCLIIEISALHSTAILLGIRDSTYQAAGYRVFACSCNFSGTNVTVQRTFTHNCADKTARIDILACSSDFHIGVTTLHRGCLNRALAAYAARDAAHIGALCGGRDLSVTQIYLLYRALLHNTEQTALALSVRNRPTLEPFVSRDRPEIVWPLPLNMPWKG